ncbi:putative disease resistance protein RGA1, partial [Ananas comosus]
MQDEIQRLQLASLRIRTILAVVEGGQTVTTKQNDVLDAWLWQLRDAVDQAEDVHDEMEYYKLKKAAQAGDNKVKQGSALNLKRKFADFANNIFRNDDTLTRLREAVREAMKALDNVAAISEVLLQLVSQLYNSDVKHQHEDEIRNTRETSSFLTEDTICGRDTEKERIVEWLTKPTSDEPENASATVGKVSAFAIVGMGGLGKTTLAQFIYRDEKVREFFDLVLWVCVSDQFDVAKLTKKIGLEKVNFMHLFNMHAFDGANIDNHVNLKLIGEQIAEKLGGCPLAAKILGGCLNSCMDEKYWRRILNENFLNLQESEDNIRMILRLSYHDLPTSLQICFRYCSIFPKNREFEKNELINMWTGSGLIKKPMHERRSLEDIGEEHLNHLARKSLFDIKIIKHGYDHKQHYVMHDLLHDLAQLVSSGECLGVEGDGSRQIPKTIRHLYLNRVNPHMVSNLKNLCTLIIHLNKDYVLVFNEALKKLKSLRLLQLTADNYKFLIEVGNLIHLHYLSLSSSFSMGNEGFILPQSMCRLYHLEVMKLQGRIKIDDSTLDRMSNLVKLRLLHIPNHMDKIPWIGKLTSLQELDNFRVREECGYKIDQLKNLQNLRKLGIGGLENIRSSEEAAEANLIEKKNLDKLSLVWSTNRSGGLEVDEPLLDNLRPHTNLKELGIVEYAGVRSPCWMTATSLSNVTDIKLRFCKRWEDLPTLGQLRSLKFLNLHSMKAVKKLLWCSTSVGSCAFPSLQELRLSDMRNLESFEGEHMFPLLKKLEIDVCPSLKSLPALPLTLNELRIFMVGLTSLPTMQQDCSSDKGRASCSSSSHPALSHLSICECPNLTSLDGFMLQQQYFPAFKCLFIRRCENLRHLPGKFFQKLPSLEELLIGLCPNLMAHGIPDNRFPETLERLTLESNGDLEFSLLEESLPKLTALQYLAIDGCASMTSLPPAELYPQLSELHISNCKELSSLDGLQALPSLNYLYIEGCDKLIQLSLLQPPLGLTSTSPTGMELVILEIDRQALLRVEPLRSLNNSVTELRIIDGTELTSLDDQGLLQNRNSLRSFAIIKASSLESLPTSMIDLQALSELFIDDAPLLRTIPELPTSMEYLSITGCSAELKEYIEGSGKFANIPRVE